MYKLLRVAVQTRLRSCLDFPLVGFPLALEGGTLRLFGDGIWRLNILLIYTRKRFPGNRCASPCTVPLKRNQLGKDAKALVFVMIPAQRRRLHSVKIAEVARLQLMTECKDDLFER